MANVKKIEIFQAITIVAISVLMFFMVSSCSKQEDVCGTIVGGYSEYNDYTGGVDYYLRLTTDERARVDELTYISSRIGDYICLDY